MSGKKLFLVGAIVLAFCFPVIAEAPQHNWTAQIASGTYGFMGYPQGTYVCYGSGHLYFTYPFYAVIAVALGIPLSVCVVGMYILRRYWEHVFHRCHDEHGAS